MYQNWTQLINQKPRELILTGDKFSKQIEEENGINSLLFKISSINFLEISKTCLSHFPSQIELLNNLTNLLLIENKLTELPLAIGKLDKLKYLDVSYNNLSEFISFRIQTRFYFLFFLSYLFYFQEFRYRITLAIILTFSL